MDTLVRDPFHQVIPNFFNLSLQDFIAQKRSNSWIRFELGELEPQEYYERLFRDGRTFDHRALEAVLFEAFEWIDGMEDLVHELWRTGFEMHALSNYPVWYRLIEKKLGLSRYLDWTFVSCRTGVRKPDTLAYTEAARKLRHPAAQCLFVDDRSSNCEAARQTGMHALVFSSASALRQELVVRGILAPVR